MFARRNASLFAAAALVIAAIYLFSGRFTPVRFDRERIEIWAAPGRVQVCGLYHYRNRSPLPTVLMLEIPFPIDARHGLPADADLVEANAEGAFVSDLAPSFHNAGEGRLRLWFRGREEKWIRLDYSQPVSSSDGRYILLTTRAWGRPLDRGEYILKLRPDLQLERSNYELMPSTQLGSNSYQFSRTDFFPDRDWTFVWSGRASARSEETTHETIPR